MQSIFVNLFSSLSWSSALRVSLGGDRAGSVLCQFPRRRCLVVRLQLVSTLMGDSDRQSAGQTIVP